MTESAADKFALIVVLYKYSITISNYNVSLLFITFSVISGRSSMVRSKPMRLEDITPDEVIQCLCILLCFTSLKIDNFALEVVQYKFIFLSSM